LAIGGFDGVHLGHQRVIQKADRVLVIEKGGTLTPGRERSRYIPVPITFWRLEKVKKFTPLQFLSLLKEKFGKIGVVVGEDFRFGANRKGDIYLLKKYFPVEVVEEVKIGRTGVHAREIRDALRRGEVERGNQLLGRPYQIWGWQVKGQGLGGRELLPTINLKIELPFLLPKAGVYCTRLQTYPSLTFVGVRSTDGKFSVEVHLLGEWKEVGERLREQKGGGEIELKGALELQFLHYLRPIFRFPSLGALRKQLMEDWERGINYFQGEIGGEEIKNYFKG
jgi:riboflavin kinase/FMN adenylyltransferase